MLGWFRARRESRQAQRQYRLALIESLMAANRRRLDELEAAQECRHCKALDSA